MDLELLAMLQMDRNLSCNLRQLRLDHQMSVEEMARIMELPPDAAGRLPGGDRDCPCAGGNNLEKGWQQRGRHLYEKPDPAQYPSGLLRTDKRGNSPAS